MSGIIHLAVHGSQFPDGVREQLLEGLRRRRIAGKFHYQSYKQAQLWLALHKAHSPAWLDPDCTRIYEEGFAAAAAAVDGRVGVIGLGCGSGYKEGRLLRLLAARGREISYVPCDVSLPLLLTAAKEAEDVCPGPRCRPLLCDAALAEDLPEALGATDARRIITFFGMMPNFEPGEILPGLAAVVRGGDVLLLSANLAPGRDYRAGVERVLPGYDNAETRAWLMAFLCDLGAEAGDGVMEFFIEEVHGLLRIAADFRFGRGRVLEVHDERFVFAAGDTVRMFFSYRYTPAGIREVLGRHGLRVQEQWVTKSEEEGVFLCRSALA
jgi:uncharacterized SAM-dependent methyltransferase